MNAFKTLLSHFGEHAKQHALPDDPSVAYFNFQFIDHDKRLPYAIATTIFMETLREGSIDGSPGIPFIRVTIHFGNVKLASNEFVRVTNDITTALLHGNAFISEDGVLKYRRTLYLASNRGLPVEIVHHFKASVLHECKVILNKLADLQWAFQISA